VDALGAGLVAPAEALLDELVVDEVVDDAWDACVPDVELVEALAVVSPYASVAPSMAAPAAVPMRRLLILTRFSLRCTPGIGSPETPGADPSDPWLQ
jgi:hypothetical protein